MMKRPHPSVVLQLCLGLVGLKAMGQALPTASGPGFKLPTIGGTLQYSLSGSEGVSNGIYGSGGLATTTNFSGNAAFITGGQVHPFSLVYSGGYILANSGQPSRFFQNLSLSQSLTIRQWNFGLSDAISYQPATPTTGLSGVPGIGDLNVDPGQTGSTTGLGILTTYGPRVTNSTTVSASRSLTGSLSLQGSGGYTILRYVGGTDDSSVSNGVDNSSSSGSGGLNYRIDARNNFAVTYNYGHSSFGGSQFSFMTQGVSGDYSRRWTRRLSTNVSGGPQRVSSSSSLTLTKPSLTLSAAAGLTYAAKQLTSSLNYIRGTGSGSGVIPGAVTDSIQYSVNHTFGRAWGVSGSLGYSRNKSLPNLTVTPFTSTGATASVQVSRAVSRRISGFASYSVQHQSIPSVNTASNAFSGYYHSASFGLTYSPGSIHFGPR